MNEATSVDPAQQGSDRGRPGPRSGCRATALAGRRQEVWVKPLAGGARAVLLFNRGAAPATIAAAWALLGWPATAQARVRDLWASSRPAPGAGQLRSFGAAAWCADGGRCSPRALREKVGTIEQVPNALEIGFLLRMEHCSAEGGAMDGRYMIRRSARTAGLFAALAVNCAFASTASASPCSSLAGTWLGTSHCSDLRAAPNCKEKRVRYRIAGAAASLDPCRPGPRRRGTCPMGDIRLTCDPRKAGGFRTSSRPISCGRWSFWRVGKMLTGELRLDNGIVSRRVEAQLTP